MSFIVLIVLRPSCVFGESRFRQLTMADGLSNARVFSVLQDHRGYIWLATEDGLDRYDGYSVTVFKNDPADPSSISSNLVKTIYEDQHHNLWVGTTGGGLDLYDYGKSTFRHFTHVPNDPSSLASDNIWSIGNTSNGLLLIGFFDAGLDILNPETGKIRHFQATPDGNGPSDDQINAILHDADGIDWIATQSGLDAFDEKHETFKHYHSRTPDNEIIRGLTKDKAGRLWIATNRGLQYLSSGTSTIENAFVGKSSPVSGNLSTVFSDHNDNLWVGSIDSGLYLKRHDSSKYIHFHQNIGDLTSLSSDALWDIYQDNSRLIWITTDNGVNIFDPAMEDTLFIRPLLATGVTTRSSNHIGAVLNNGDSLWFSSTAGIYTVPLKLTDQTSSMATKFLSSVDPQSYRIITSFLRLNKNTVLAATGTGWILSLDNNGKIRRRWKVGEKIRSNGLIIFGIIKNRPDTVLMATYGNGLLEYNFHTNATTSITGESGTKLPDSAKLLEFTKTLKNQLFLATTNGLFHIDLDNYKCETVRLNPSGTDPEPISLYANNGHLWVGTIRGLWDLTLDSHGNVEKRKYYSVDNNSVSGIEPDEHGNLWLAGDNSVIRLDPKTGLMLKLGNAQNLPVSGFYAYVHARTKNGWLWFGGPDGLIGLDPQKIKATAVTPQVAISSVSIDRNNNSIRIRNHDNQPIKLTYSDSLITFNLAVLDYGFPYANKFSYRLTGSQSNWTPPSTAHQIIFPSLEPGHYSLEVKGANNWGVWSKIPASLEIIVTPPWWRTMWAYALYVVILLGTFFAYVYVQQQKLRKEREISSKLRDADAIKSNFVSELEIQVRKATSELRNTLETVNLKNQELEVAHKRASDGEQVKSQFLANMSHELRTPLTAILGYLKLLLQTDTSVEQTEYINTIQNSSESLLAIINDTLDLSRIESGKLLIDEINFDLLNLIESTVELLGPSAYQKQLSLIRIIPPDTLLRLRGDPLRIRQILTNLVGNAIKFTQNGSVCIRVQEIERREKDVMLGIAISDTGIGIPTAGIKKLFNAYARHESPSTVSTEGTGLGLSICKKLLDLMGGEIEVLSTPGLGSTFEFRLAFKLQKDTTSSSSNLEGTKIGLFDNHPLSHQAWRASLVRLGLEVVPLNSLKSLEQAHVNVFMVVCDFNEIDQLTEMANDIASAQIPHLLLAPITERKTLELISEICACPVHSTLVRESILLSSIQELVPSRPSPSESEDGKQIQTDSRIPELGQLSILVADDNAINRKLLTTLLMQNGYIVSEAANGKELLKLAETEHWAAALIDIHMPDMTGMEVAEKLQASGRFRSQPIIAISADALPETRTKALAAGMRDYLVKPYTETELLEMLRRYLPQSSI